MKKHLLTVIIAGLTFSSIGQLTDFENTLPSADTAWFGQDQVIDGDTTFISGGLEFETNYNAMWQSFTGWGYSNSFDVTTPGFANQYSTIAGSGAENSGQFGICYANGNTRAFSKDGYAMLVDGAYFTNTTYAYLSMRDGDNFAKQFGDSTNASGTIDGTNGEDWFLLTIYGLDIDSARTGDSVNFYLADYRFSDNSQDYIVDSWEYVDLSGLEAAVGLDFKLSSSDEGMFGMNTPAYFAMDRLYSGHLSVQEQILPEFTMFPNPAQNSVTIITPEKADVKILDISGKLVYSQAAVQGQIEIALDDLNSGIYLVQIQSNGAYRTQKLVKQ